MVLLHTPAVEKAFQAPDFSLLGTDGKTYSLQNVQGEKGTVILFICNHCPYVKVVIGRMVSEASALQKAGFGVAAIMPNDTENYPEDSFENMKLFARDHDFSFPYLIDQTQDIARAYGAVCTPDIFGFDALGALQYRGRLDSAGKDEAESDTRRELFEAMIMVAESGHGPQEQFPSMGCSIKWKE